MLNMCITLFQSLLSRLCLNGILFQILIGRHISIGGLLDDVGTLLAVLLRPLIIELFIALGSVFLSQTSIS